jgi:hypothetical protein
MVPSRQSELQVHAPLAVSLLAVAAVVLAAFQWLREVVSEKRQATSITVSTEFALRFALIEHEAGSRPTGGYYRKRSANRY